MKGSAATLIIVTVVIIAVMGMLGYIIFFRPSSEIGSPAPNPASVIPTIAVKDFAPSLPSDQKTTILIQQSDSSEIKYIVPTDQVDTYVKSLPQGAHVISKIP